MLYVIVALKSEAQAFVDKYKLKKSKLNDFTMFFNKKIVLIVSGIGVYHARVATQTLVNNFDIGDEDIYLNVGICASDKEHKIGELIDIGSISYDDVIYEFKRAENILCLDKESSNKSDKLVDMESYGFYDAVIHSTAIKHFYILKIVSDNFEPHKITKEMTKTLIFNQLNAINKIIFKEEEI